MKKQFFVFVLLQFLVWGCKKSPAPDPVPPTPPASITIQSATLNGTAVATGGIQKGVMPASELIVKFSEPVSQSTAGTTIKLNEANSGSSTPNIKYSDDDKTLTIGLGSLKYLTNYSFSIANTLKSSNGGALKQPFNLTIQTGIDSSNKFPLLSDNDLLTLVQKQTFKYFWDFAHPASGLARERNTSGDVVTSGGSGFGIMAILVGIERGFVTKAEGLARMEKIVDFLKDKAEVFHGAYPHWLDGNTGKAVAFSAKDDGADLVETSLLAQGLLTARQYFKTTATAEVALRNNINSILNRIEWSWFRKNNENVLYWHWSPNHNWDMNMPIKGWNESLITYVLAASSSAHSIPKEVYMQGWAGNGTNGFINGGSYYNINLPLGPPYGGPLFFSHYSFLGLNPNSLTDQYADYKTQVTNHTKINHIYSVDNPKKYYGYSDKVWGLTASDIKDGYTASSPTNDVGVIAPTAALSSFPYTPEESMKALKFFYYVLGDKLWKEYGFVDAFSLDQLWFADSHLAIDQGPIIIMIENYRTKLLWNLFTSAPEVKTGLRKLGFTADYL